MRRVLTRTAFVGLLALAACIDNQSNSGLPSEPSVGGPQAIPAPGTCTSLATLNSLANTVFASGNPNANSVKGKLSNMDKDIKKGKLADAQQKAIDIVAFILKKKGSFEPQATLLDFINKVLCYAALPAGLSDLGGISVVTASETETTETYRDDQQAGLVVPPGAFDAPPGTQILITMSPALGGLINTLLDQYPGVFNIQASAALDGTVIVGVCLTVDVAADIFARLRLGHDLDLGDFEITPDADPPPGLNCDPTPGSAPPSLGFLGNVPRFLASVGDFFLPQPLTASVLTGGGVGGSAGKLSPFGPVDPQLSATGGTGGTAGKLTPPALVLGPGGPRPHDVLDCSFPVGTPVSEACRPQVTIMTAQYKAWLDGGQEGPQQGNLIPNVPVEFEVGSGGGLVGPEGACTPSSGLVTINTNASGFARACWTLGNSVGEQKVWVTPKPLEEIPDVYFDPATVTFFATATNVGLFGSAFSGSSGAASLYEIDATTGTGTLIGAIGFDRVGAMDFHPTTGVLYATGQRPSDNVPVLITINVTTGVGTEVGATGISGNISDVSFRSDGTLFVYDATASNHRVYTANVTTGAATLVGSTGLSSNSGNGIVFDGSSVLHHSNRDFAHTLSQTTGTATPGAGMSYPSQCTSIGFGRIGAADLDTSTNTFYAAIQCGSGTGGEFLGTVNYSTGVVTIIGPSVPGLDGLARRN